ncbi:MAG: DNA polymerase III subunit delta' [Rhodocyclaceae bacterium]|nr:DNA polymerase III subunit delta' [Rhodocyclaceae bacterium]
MRYGERLPHAMLFSGAAGAGKLELALRLAARLLCLHPAPWTEGGQACGECSSCRVLAAGNHPDLRLIQPEEEDVEEGAESPKKKGSYQIKIQQIRELDSFFNVTPHISSARVCIIEPAEAMNLAAANALLKILEEPSASFYFIMVSHRWRELLPTLRSRAQHIACPPPDARAAVAWLEAQGISELAHWLPFFGFAPGKLWQAHLQGQLGRLQTFLAELSRLPEPLSLAEKLEAWQREGLELPFIVETLQKWLCDLALHEAIGKSRFLPQPYVWPPRVGLENLVRVYRELNPLRNLARHPLNARLFLEELCVRALAPWQERRLSP